MKKAVISYLAVIVLFGIVLCWSIFFTGDNGCLPFPEPMPPIDDDFYKIDLNTATAEELMLIPGVGQALAENIIHYREINGPFQEYAELLNVSGIGQKKLAVILEYIRIK